MSGRRPFPLQWPDGVPRTPGFKRERSRFDATVGGGVQGVLRELRLLHASQVVITSDLPTRGDGLPYADARAADPGIAVYWVRRGREMVMACDRYRTPAENLRAIEKSIEAIRGLDRWGSSAIVERAFAGFAALPPGSPPSSAPAAPPEVHHHRPWRDVLGGGFEGLDQADALAVAKARHRRLMHEHHPDVGGTHDRAAELNTALAEAERELGA